MSNKFDARAQILKKYKKLYLAAEALGIEPATLSKNLDKLTPDFIKRLKDIGVIIEDSNIAGRDIQDRRIIHSDNENAAELEMLKRENESLKKQIEELRKDKEFLQEQLNRLTAKTA